MLRRAKLANFTEVTIMRPLRHPAQLQILRHAIPQRLCGLAAALIICPAVILAAQVVVVVASG